jgi:ADP-heptose:LPS heptosyltransferase
MRSDWFWKRFHGTHPPVSVEESGRRLLAAREIRLVDLHRKRRELLPATPLVRNLRLAVPGARLTFIASPGNAAAVLDHPDLDRVETVGFSHLLECFRAHRTVRRLGRDPGAVCLVLSLDPVTVAVARQSGPDLMIGTDEESPGNADAGVDCLVPPPDESRVHVVDAHLSLLERLGVPVRDREHRLGVTGDQRRAAGEALAGAGVDPERPVFGVHVGGPPSTGWAPANYAALLQRAAGLGCQTILLGDADGTPAVEQVRALGKTPIPALLGLPFGTYKGVLSRLSFFLTHDGEPVQIAAGVGVPSLFLFLSTPAWRWAPYGSHIAVWDEGGTVPHASEVWERIKPRLVASRDGGAGRGGGTPA